MSRLKELLDGLDAKHAQKFDLGTDFPLVLDALSKVRKAIEYGLNRRDDNEIFIAEAMAEGKDREDAELDVYMAKINSGNADDTFSAGENQGQADLAVEIEGIING